MPKSTVRTPARAYAAAWRVTAALCLLTLLLLGVGLGSLPLLLVLYYLGAGLVSFVLYGFDKGAAIHGDWRIPEARLQSADLLGGIIGGLLAQIAFRHKIAKPEFGAGSALIAAFHGFGLGAVLTGFVHLPGLG